MTVTGNDPYQQDIESSSEDYLYWTGQVSTQQQTLSDDCNTLQAMYADNASVYAILNVFSDMDIYCDICLGFIGAQEGMMGAVSNMIGDMMTKFGEGGSISDQDAADFQQELVDLNNDITGVNGQPPLIPLSPSDQQSMENNISTIVKAYQHANGETETGNPNDLTGADIQNAQKKWEDESTGDNAQEDPDFTTVSSTLTQMSQQVTSINGSLQSQQQLWSDMDTNIQKTWNEAMTSQQTMVTNMVNAQKTTTS